MTEYNPIRLESFEMQYRAALAIIAMDNPSYFMAGRSPGEVADRMIEAIKTKGIGTVSIDGEGFKKTCKALNIKKTYKAIQAYLEGE